MFQFSTSSYSDIGGYYENQDKSFYLKLNDEIFIHGVFDGNGSNGNIVATTANEFAISYFTENEKELELNSKEIMTKFCDLCNEKIRITLLEKVHGSYLEKDFLRNKNGTILHGGTTCTIIAIVKGILHSICLGDSTSSLHIKNSKISKDLCIKCIDTFNDEEISLKESDIINENMLIISGDQSPEDESEYERTKLFGGKHLYELRSFGQKAIFNIDGTKNQITNEESDCTTVRGDFPSILESPDKKFVLALTRALGDFYMCQYGLTWKPIYRSINLLEFVKEDSQLCIVTASDGVWDNWKYEDVHDFIMHESCINSMMSSESGAQNVAKAFIERNDVYAMRNFGKDRDNATVVLTFIKVT
jgi:serine/threonine protein phosphatase PrpC